MNAESPRSATRADQVSPDDLLEGFSRGTLARWFLMALAIHAVVIGGFSVGTIRDWVDPEGAKSRKEALIAAAKAAAEPAAPPAAEGRPAEPAAADARPVAEEKVAEPTAAAAKTPIEKATTEAARPDEIPNAPDDLGLSIDDTNPK